MVESEYQDGASAHSVAGHTGNDGEGRAAAVSGATYQRGAAIMRGTMIPSDSSTAKLLRNDDGAAWLNMDPWRVLRIQSEFVEGFDELAAIGPAVSVYGSARTRPDEPDYQTAQRMGRYFFVRKTMFVKYSSGVIVCPGGFGTLDEMFELLTLVQTHKVTSMPVVLYGKAYWQGLLDWLNGPVKEQGMISGVDPHLVTMTDDADEAVDIAVGGIGA